MVDCSRWTGHRFLMVHGLWTVGCGLWSMGHGPRSGEPATAVIHPSIHPSVLPSAICHPPRPVIAWTVLAAFLPTYLGST